MSTRGARTGAPAHRASPLLTAVLLASLAGSSALAWLAVCARSDQREAWDTGEYFAVVLPGLCAAAALTGWLRPERAWRWPLALVAGQAVGLGISSGLVGSLGPLPLVAFAVIGLPCFAAAAVAARMARRR